MKLLKAARKHTQKSNGGIAVIIARHPCLIRYPGEIEKMTIEVEITEDCNLCMYCLDYFECPALRLSPYESRVEIDRILCIDCGVCLEVCPRKAIVPVKKKQKGIS